MERVDDLSSHSHAMLFISYQKNAQILKHKKLFTEKLNAITLLLPYRIIKMAKKKPGPKYALNLKFLNRQKRPNFSPFTSPLLKLNKIARKNFSSTSFNFYIKHKDSFSSVKTQLIWGTKFRSRHNLFDGAHRDEC